MYHGRRAGRRVQLLQRHTFIFAARVILACCTRFPLFRGADSLFRGTPPPARMYSIYIPFAVTREPEGISPGGSGAEFGARIKGFPLRRA